MLAHALFMSACSSPNGGHDAGVHGDAASEDYCHDFVEAVVAHYEECGCQSALVAEMRTQLSQCVFTTVVPIRDQLVMSGEVKYHPEAFAALTARLRADDGGCETFFGDLGLDSISVYGLGGVYEGTREVGASCTPVTTKGGINTCKVGALCLPGEDGDGRCLKLVGKGEACDVGPAPRNLCHDRRPPDIDNEFESSFDALTCIADGAGTRTGTCRDQLDDGSVCAMNDACKSGRCAEGDDLDARCAPKLPAGAMCFNRSDCQVGTCSGVCRALLDDGMDCDYDDLNCKSGSCHRVEDGAHSSSAGTCGPKLTKQRGETCTQGYECVSGTCRDGACRPHLCR